VGAESYFEAIRLSVKRAAGQPVPIPRSFLIAILVAQMVPDSD